MKKITPDLKKIEEEWDIYWIKSSKKSNIRKYYDFVASFYRNYLIGPSFKYYIKKNFKKNTELLHAGCGGGEVDSFITHNYKITAVDISTQALKLYKKINPNVSILKSDIFDMNLNENKFEGIYNLGVIEHFNEQKFIELMLHFKKHLKKNGKIILFWPPKFGLSVIALHLIHFFINKVFRLKIKLHPEEPFKYESKNKLKKILEPIGYKIKNTHFNYRDAFTYCIIIIELS